MFQELNGYLFQHGSISIPGLGTIHIDRVPAMVDTPNHQILPPLHNFRFDKYFDAPDREFFLYLSEQKNIPDYEAIKWYSEFSYSLREKIRLEEKVQWDGVGVLKKDFSGNIVFESSAGNPFFLEPVPATKVIRANAEHSLRAGDWETNNVVMSQWLQEETPVNQRWWLPALIAGAVCILILIFYFSLHGWSSSSSGNQQVIQLSK